MKVVICSAFRNARQHLDRYFQQVDGLQRILQSRGDSLMLILGYGDSTDGTDQLIREFAGFSVGALLIDCSHGGPVYGSIVNAQRFKQLAHVANKIWACIPPEADAAMFLDGDLIWEPRHLAALLGRLKDYPAVAPRVLHASNPGYKGNGPFWYDTWAFRCNGQQFGNYPPYHPALGADMLQLDSAGACLAIRGELARQVRFTEDEVIVGLCKQINERGESIFLDPALVVFHP